VTLSAEDLLAGAALMYEVDIPPDVLHPSVEQDGDEQLPAQHALPATVRIRPLTVRDLQIIARGAKERDSLMAALMVQRSLVEPELSVAEVSGLHVGLLQFLLRSVNRCSGISADPAELALAAEAPIARAAFILSREFGWTPEQVNDLTLGQVLLHLQLLRESEGP
jgi:hypothetical protein